MTVRSEDIVNEYRLYDGYAANSAGTPFPGTHAHLAAVGFGSFTKEHDHTYSG